MSILTLFFFITSIFFLHVLKIIMTNYYLDFILYLLCVILVIALVTLLERKILGGLQRRRGPNKVGIFGIIQPIADALKLIFKETIIPGVSNWYLFIIAPLLIFLLSIINWTLIPLQYGLVYIDNPITILIMLAIMSLSVFSIVIAGWSSNSKYALIGGIRAAAQMISYELSLGIILLNLATFVNNLNLTSVVEIQQECQWFIFFYFPQFLMFFVIALAETNRVPFDLPEAESELVSGYNVEYSSIMFAFFFLAEYSSILIMCALISIFFLGGWLSPIYLLNDSWLWFCLKINFILYFYIVIRGTLPRYRYDQLMMLGWKVLLPLALTFFFYNNILLLLI